MLLAACGQQHKARSIVDDFMDENMSGQSAIHAVDYAKLDSTRLIGDSLIQAMRKAAEKNKLFRHPITYAEGNPTPLLFITRVDYKVGDKECQDTYYLDADLTRVVAFKSLMDE